MMRIFRYSEDLIIATAMFCACFVLYGMCKEQLARLCMLCMAAYGNTKLQES